MKPDLPTPAYDYNRQGNQLASVGTVAAEKGKTLEQIKGICSKNRYYCQSDRLKSQKPYYTIN